MPGFRARSAWSCDRTPETNAHRLRWVGNDEGYRIDLLADSEIIVELKAVARLEDVHEAQLLSYVRLAKKPVGLLINFNVPRLAEGVRRVVNGPHQLSL